MFSLVACGGRYCGSEKHVTSVGFWTPLIRESLRDSRTSVYTDGVESGEASQRSAFQPPTSRLLSPSTYSLLSPPRSGRPHLNNRDMCVYVSRREIEAPARGTPAASADVVVWAPSCTWIFRPGAILLRMQPTCVQLFEGVDQAFIYVRRAHRMCVTSLPKAKPSLPAVCFSSLLIAHFPPVLLLAKFT